MGGAGCLQPGCGGLIEGGFCNLCGMEPLLVSAPSAPLRTGTGFASAAGSGLSGRTGSSSSRRGTAGARGSSRKTLGLGMVALPDLPPLDPERAVMADPVVPETKRFCPNPDCHDGSGNPTPLTRRQGGHCPQCGRKYSFVPTLKPGDLVADQYEVKGCLAFGGLGWIYLARDTVLNRWVVLKGLLNAADASAAAAAVAERQFLAAVKHPNVVNIYNFVTRGTEGFIVMEFVGGVTLKQLRKDRGPLPPAEALAYVHRALTAFAYLHRQGLVYCDFKPDNCMLEGEPPDVKVIDLGGVRRLDDTGGDIYGTVGYSAPEVAAEGPSVVSDLYTIGRTLAVLVMDFRFQSVYQHTLPPASEQPVLARYDPLHRFLLRATHPRPDLRFQSAEEMADQLAGVLRSVVAETGTPPPAESSLFGGDVLALREDASATGVELLPEVKPPTDDPAVTFLASVSGAPPAREAALLADARKKYPTSAALLLRTARCLIGTGSYTEAERLLVARETADPFDWRVTWYRGVSLLTRKLNPEAREAFDRVYSELPGEPAAQLALAVAAEAADDTAAAAWLYDLVSRTDPSFASAAFGLARCRLKEGKRDDAVRALDRVPPASSLYVKARSAVARALIGTSGTKSPSADAVIAAAAAVEPLELGALERAELRAEVLEAALTVIRSGPVPADATLFGSRFEERAVRRALEAELRQRAKFAPDRATRIELVDRANAVRPVTWI
jgi:serine/threonine-protein kinase PknG